jgi:hypothetical protein
MYSQKGNCAASLFPKQNYKVLSPNSYTHTVYQDQSVYFAAAKYVDRSWEYIIAHRHMTVGIGTEAAQFLFGAVY